METIQELFRQGGIMMYPLLFSSILALAVSIEKFLTLKTSKIIDPKILSVLDAIKSNEDINVAKNVCKSNLGVFSNIVLVALEYREESQEQIRQILNDQGRQEVRVLESRLGILETISGIAPLLGLLGTVLGMIQVFKVIAEKGLGNPALLSGGISEALVTTAVGLVIGILALISFNYFDNKANSIILDIEKYSTELVLKLSKL
ncbi:MAG: MotA/TolQ/ExbB proton channel family protein [Calditrichaeota bacterium]|nr:MAG: MotA/TolQ/ExbB proton channel family protein [Calditrichota bacterium]